MVEACDNLNEAGRKVFCVFQQAKIASSNLSYNKSQDTDSSKEKNILFQKLYLEMMTDAFGDEIDSLRRADETETTQFNLSEEEGNANADIDLDVMVDLLKSGMDVFDDVEKFRTITSYPKDVLPYKKLQKEQHSSHESFCP